MKKTSFFCLLLLSLSVLFAGAQGTAADKVKRLQARMYKLYPGHDYELFISVTDSLKEAALAAGDERTFYKAWANQAQYSNNRQRRNRGLQIAKELLDHALKHNHKYGIYIGTHVAAYTLGQMGSFKEAQEEFKKAIAYAHEFLPDESAASSLLELAKMEMYAYNKQQAMDYCEQAKREPNLNPLHRLNAYSIQCMSIAISLSLRDKGGSPDEFTHYYDLREEAKKAYGRDDIYGPSLKLWKAIIEGDYDKAEQLTETLESVKKKDYQRIIAYMRGDYHKAYSLLWRYERMADSIDRQRNAHLLTEMITSMNVGRLENEQRELRMRNQALQLENMANELEQHRLEEEALGLSLKNKEVELQNASVRQQNDSLEKYNKDLQISEYESKMAAHESAAQTRRVFAVMGSVIAALVIAALGFTAWRRAQHERHLRQINNQLSEANANLRLAYGQLEETTAQKERIESELRIARDIQMSMVPHEFPDRKGLKLYASMTPAKEVGGDLYHYLLLDDLLYFCVGDVSGKGVPASLFMAQTVRMFHVLAMQGMKPAEIANRMNADFSVNNEQGMFVTMFIGQADLRTGKLDFCNAGHNAPVLSDDEGGHFIEMEPNAPIGLWPELEYVGETIADIKGRPLFVYTDGLSEAENELQEQFGDEQLLEILRGMRYHDARKVVETLAAKVEEHRNGAEPNDDLTMLCLEIDP